MEDHLMTQFAGLRSLVCVALVVGRMVFASFQAPAYAQGLQVPTGGFGDLISALRGVEGCLGVELAKTGNGKQLVFAWFENKAAVLRWYYSDAHLGSMALMGATPSRPPLADIPDDGEPIMAIASVTLAPPAAPDAPPTISQVSIELYRPAPGGFSQGGTFAPENLVIRGMVRAPASRGTTDQGTVRH
jgi:hypothetical protein